MHLVNLVLKLLSALIYYSEMMMTSKRAYQINIVIIKKLNIFKKIKLFFSKRLRRQILNYKGEVY